MWNVFVNISRRYQLRIELKVLGPSIYFSLCFVIVTNSVCYFLQYLQTSIYKLCFISNEADFRVKPSRTISISSNLSYVNDLVFFFLKLNDKINCAHILVGSYDLLDRRINDVTINNILVVFFIIHSKEIPCYRWSVQLKITVPHLAAPRVPLLFFVIYCYWPEARYAESIFYFDLRYLGVVTTQCYSSMQFLILYKVSRPSLLVCG